MLGRGFTQVSEGGPFRVTPKQFKYISLVMWIIIWLPMHLFIWAERNSYLAGQSYFAVAQVFAMGLLGAAGWWIPPFLWAGAFTYAAMERMETDSAK
jgi:hypothetical protein